MTRELNIGSNHAKSVYYVDADGVKHKAKAVYKGSTLIFPYMEITKVACAGDVPACGGMDYQLYITVTYSYNGIERQKSAIYTHTWASLGQKETTGRTKLTTLTVYIDNDENISFSSGSISGTVDIYQAINKKDDYCDDPVYGTLTATSEIIGGAITSDKMAKASGGYVSLQLKAVQSKTIQWYYTSGAEGSKTETTASVKWSGDGSQYLASSLGTTPTTATLVKTMQNTATSEHGDVASTSCEIWQEANTAGSPWYTTTGISLSLDDTSFSAEGSYTHATLVRYYNSYVTYTSGDSKKTGSDSSTISNPYPYLTTSSTMANINSANIQVYANDTTSSRSCKITAKYDGKESSVTITQAAAASVQLHIEWTSGKLHAWATGIASTDTKTYNGSYSYSYTSSTKQVSGSGTTSFSKDVTEHYLLEPSDFKNPGEATITRTN